MTFPTQIQHVIVIALENEDFATVMSDTFFSNLANTYSVCTNYAQICHPSLPNYIAVTSGTTLWNGTDKCGTDDASWGTNNSENIFNLVNKAGLTWMAFAEPDSGNYDPCSTSNIAVRHFPAVFYSNIVSNQTYCQSHVRPITDWYNLVNQPNPQIPNFVWITPNQCDDGETCSFPTVSNWVQNVFNLPNLISQPWFSNTCFIIWFDESYSYSAGVGTYVSLISPISNKLSTSISYNNYNVLSTIEWLLGLGNCGNNDSVAIPIKELFTPLSFSASLSINPNTIDIGQSVTFTVNAMGGIAPYNYKW